MKKSGALETPLIFARLLLHRRVFGASLLMSFRVWLTYGAQRSRSPEDQFQGTPEPGPRQS